MFGKILVANRGEIACRIIVTARRMGIRTVAVFSEADRNALHVEMADEGVSVGPPQASQSYLSIAKIVEAARATGADAVHPGYGFLAENPALPRALEASDIVFIGPPASAIEAMGDKIQSKRTASAAGVATVPGHLDIIRDADAAARIAADIGYPVMIKASAGGGGKGMRTARDESALREGLQGARAEAGSAFGDDRVFLEKLIEDPRHIEIQVLADAHGNIIHLGERECSIQRRNQKIVEEAPSPFLDAETRATMGGQAVALAEAVGYQSAGTVEFIVDRDRNFYFLEMNTRLQVEHPVTELVTGLDLVEWMIRIAAGERLTLKQRDVRLSGSAIEARIYAEDPYRDFLPSAGRLIRYRPPPTGKTGYATIRVDGGVEEGAEISLFYDPMIAKLCAHAPSRAAAIDAMSDALETFVIDGIRHNVSFLAALLAHPRFREGRLSTAFIDEEFPGGFRGAEPEGKEREILAAVAISAGLIGMRQPRPIKVAKSPRPVSRDWVLDLGGEQIPVRVSEDTASPSGASNLSFGGLDIRIETHWRPGERVWKGNVAGRQVVAQVEPLGYALNVSRRGASLVARLLTPRAAELALLMPAQRRGDTSKTLLCPMPGLVVSIAVVEGQEVAAGEALATVEAMKMENVLRAERSAKVARILARPGDILAVDAVIMEFA